MIQQMKKLKTAEEAKAEIRSSGLTITKWSVRNGLAPSIVADVLRGRLQGHYGEAHKAAVLLGMKKGEINEDSSELKRT